MEQEAISFPLVVVLLLAILTCLSPNVSSTTHWDDTQVLNQLRTGLDPTSVPPGSCLSSWDFSFDPCDNLFTDRFTCGFRCDSTDPSTGSLRVTEIALDQAGYSGSLASVPFNRATYLQTLDLSHNNIHGPVPESLSGLTRLTRLGLSGNHLTGPIPASIGSLVNLQELYLDDNNLQGTIPPTLGSLPNLNRLELQTNRLTGVFPTELGPLTNLQFLDLSNNLLSGPMPTDTNQFPPSLVQILARNNSLQGPIPETLRALTSLQVLDLTLNQLTGPVPYFLFTHPSLEQLVLTGNRLTSVQAPPVALSALHSQLISVDFSGNELAGQLPEFLAIMPRLSAVSLENNRFTGMIPMAYAIKAVVPTYGASQLTRLLLGGNYLFGPIPGPILGLYRDGDGSSLSSSVDVSLYGNCLYRCPMRFFFCQGGEQRSPAECRGFSPVVP